MFIRLAQFTQFAISDAIKWLRQGIPDCSSTYYDISCLPPPPNTSKQPTRGVVPPAVSRLVKWFNTEWIKYTNWIPMKRPAKNILRPISNNRQYRFSSSCSLDALLFFPFYNIFLPEGKVKRSFSSVSRILKNLLSNTWQFPSFQEFSLKNCTMIYKQTLNDCCDKHVCDSLQ